MNIAAGDPGIEVDLSASSWISYFLGVSLVALGVVSKASCNFWPRGDSF